MSAKSVKCIQVLTFSKKFVNNIIDQIISSQVASDIL